jgi:hypothetical protein
MRNQIRQSGGRRLSLCSITSLTGFHFRLDTLYHLPAVLSPINLMAADLSTNVHQCNWFTYRGMYWTILYVWAVPIKGREETIQITGAQQSGRGPGAPKFCLSCSVVSLVRINHFKPSLGHSAIDNQSFRISVKIFSRSALAARPKNDFCRNRNSFSAALCVWHFCTDVTHVCNYRLT